jgi:hypothetical protein
MFEDPTPTEESQKMESASLTRKAEDLGRRLLEQARRDHGAGTKVERVLMVASVTEENGSQRAVVVSADGMEPYEKAGTLRHALRAITAPQRTP